MNEEEAGVQYLANRAERLEGKARLYLEALERVDTLIGSSVDSYYTLKMVQKMVVETLRLAREGNEL